MALDANGNYYVQQVQDGPGAPVPSGGVLYGPGAPDNSLGSNGNTYVNTTNGNFYTKSGDVWILQGSAGGGIEQVIVGAFDDPNGNVTPTDVTKGAIYSKDGAFSLWKWNVGAANWTPLMS